MKSCLEVNKELKTAFVISILFSILFYFYEISWGLMDDYKWIVRTEEFVASPLNSYIEFQKYMVGKGTLQPFIHLQYIIQYIPGIYISPIITFIQNIFILFFSHYLLFKVMSKKLSINYYYSLMIFLIFPYTFDMFLLPSLQEKFSIPLFAYLVHRLHIAEDLKNNNLLTIFLISFIIPLVKLQGSVFVLFIFFYYLFHRSSASLSSILGFAFSISIQAYLIFFTDSGYYIVDTSSKEIIRNILSFQNLLFLLIIMLSILISVFDKNIENKYYIYGYSFSSLAIVFILINWEQYGYLYAFYAFFLCILVPYCIGRISNMIDRKSVTYSLSISLIVLTFTSSFMFFLPRIERWSDLNSVYDTLESNIFNSSVYYCASEGVLTFNNLLKENKNTVKLAGNFIDITESNFVIIKDDLQCDYLTDNIQSECILTKEFPSTFNRSQINEYSC